MDLDIVFGEATVTTPVYIKMDAHDQLLLSEGVCRQLGILRYHPSVERWRGGKRKSNTESAPEDGSTGEGASVDSRPVSDEHSGAKVPTVRRGIDRLFPRCLETPPRAQKGWGQAHREVVQR